MPTLILTPYDLPDTLGLARVAHSQGWRVVRQEPDVPPRHEPGSSAIYGDVEWATELQEMGWVALLEPEDDLLAELPWEAVKREITALTPDQALDLRDPTFLKPANPRHKSVLDPAVRRQGTDLELRQQQSEEPVPLLASEPVNWLVEYRCFVLEGEVVDGTPYLRQGRRFRYGEPRWPIQEPEWNLVHDFAEDVLEASPSLFPAACVLDVGLIEDRGWAVIETNPVWCSALYGCQNEDVLEVLERACQARNP